MIFYFSRNQNNQKLKKKKKKAERDDEEWGTAVFLLVLWGPWGEDTDVQWAYLLWEPQLLQGADE